MGTIKITGRVLAASREERVLSGLLLPYGEEGRTNVGRITAAAGAVELPEDPSTVKLDIEHDLTRPVGKATAITETEEGLVATFAIARTRTGDDILEEADEGLRTGLSVEVDDPVIRAGALVGGRLAGAAVCVSPAFPSAQLAASDMGEVITTVVDSKTTSSSEFGEMVRTEHVETVTEYRPPADPATAEEDPAEQAEAGEDPADIEASDATGADEQAEATPSETEGEEPQKEETVSETTLTAAAVPVGSMVAPKAQEGVLSIRQVAQRLAAAFTDGGEKRMLAALSDITGNANNTQVSQWVGELWSGKAYQRRFIPLFNQAPLTSYKVRGWRWTTKPEVATYAGNKAAVTSNSAATESVEITAKRLAGAHDIDRKYRDFGDTAFFESYFRAMVESYARLSDVGVLTDIRTAALASGVAAGTVPSGVSAGITAVVDGALAIIDTATPSFAVVSSDLYRGLLLTRSDDVLAYLNAALGFEDGQLNGQNFRIMSSGALGPKQVLVGARDAATVHELGSVPIRVEAEDIAKGGIDEGVFGYYAVNVHDADALALVSTFAWATSTDVTLGTVYVMPDDKVLEVTTAGTTASTGTGPTAPSAVAGTVTDGTAVWTRRA